MARRITEEQVTKTVLFWLESEGWQIISFDFPQSGTGILLHPNNELRISQNKNAFIPDIVAEHHGNVIFCENKDHFTNKDFEKQNNIKETAIYSESISKLLSTISYTNIFYGISIPETKRDISEFCHKVDFVLYVQETGSIRIHYDPANLFQTNLSKQ